MAQGLAGVMEAGQSVHLFHFAAAAPVCMLRGPYGLVSLGGSAQTGASGQSQDWLPGRGIRPIPRGTLRGA